MVRPDDQLTIAEVNDLDQEAFMVTFGTVYESTPRLAVAAWGSRPFVDRSGLVDAFRIAAEHMDTAALFTLLGAHPALATPGPQTAASQAEPRPAGLTDLDAETQARITDGTARYLERFGFPFIIAVRGRGPAEIAAALEARLEHDDITELDEALAQVNRIAELRIARLVAP